MVENFKLLGGFSMHSSVKQISRRDFFKIMALSGYFLAQPQKMLFANEQPFGIMDFKFRTMSVKHLPEIQNKMDQVLNSGKVSQNETFQSYIKDRKFQLPENFQDAKTIIVVAKFTNAATVNFNYNGKKYPTYIPPQYWDDGTTLDALTEEVQKQVIKSKEYKLEIARGFFMKRLATSCGLAKYGRNNIAYVDEYGTFITLFTFLTDWESPEDHYTEVQQLDLCDTCNLCLTQCPTGAIRKEEFIIDVSKCATLYNETDAAFPEDMPKSVHDSLMGCMQCQKKCPYNAKVMEHLTILEDISEEDTEKILTGKWNTEKMKSVAEKLNEYYPATDEEYFPVFTKNLGVLIN